MTTTNRHSIVARIPFTCDDMHMTAEGVIVLTGDRGYFYDQATGICTSCRDVAYACDACKKPTCVNDGMDTAKGGWFCPTCSAGLETCEGCGREAPNMWEVSDGWVVCNNACWVEAERKWKLTPEGRKQEFAHLVALNVDDLDWTMGLHTGRYTRPMPW